MCKPSKRNSSGMIGLLSLIVFFFFLIASIIIKRKLDDSDYVVLILSGCLGLRYGIYYKGYFSNRDEVRRNILGATFSNICIPILIAMPYLIWELRFIYILLAIAIWLLILVLVLVLRYGNGFTGRSHDNIYNFYCYKYIRPPFWRKKERVRYDLEAKEELAIRKKNHYSD